METDKIEEAKDECLVVVAKASAAILKGGPIPNITPAFDALIAAVREEQKAKCEARVLALNWVAEPDLNDIVEAIRNA